MSWWDVLGLSLVAGIGFTVSLLIGELAYGAGSDLDNHVKIGVLLGSVPPPCSPPCSCGSATATTARSASRRPSATTATEYPTPAQNDDLGAP